MPGRRLRLQQKEDTQQFPALFSTAQPGQVEHLLFQSLDEPELAFDRGDAVRLIAQTGWRSQASGFVSQGKDDRRAGEEGWLVYLSYEYAQAIWPSRKLSRAQDSAVGPLCAVQRVKLAGVGVEANISSSNAKIISKSQWREPAETPFLAGVKRIQDYIRAGDVYQVNLSRSWETEYNGDGADLYARLLAHNPAPFSARLCLPEFEIISSSPERLFELRGAQICTQPIAGTRPRGEDVDADHQLRDELIAHPKERAEHIMLVDLERNDLGRICVPGTVEVPRLMDVEPYKTVQHIVSDVRGQLKQGTRLEDILAAVFPGGTITGCPKLRCMEILAELEPQPRGAYTGSLGYCLDNGQADFNILIRTIQKFGRQLRLDAGAGIVASSNAIAELEETRAKASGVIRALARGD